MPELPEVETVVRQLGPVVEGKQVLCFHVFDPRLNLPGPEKVGGRRLKRIERLGKQIIMGLEKPGHEKDTVYLVIHLRMTGRLIWQDQYSLPHMKDNPSDQIRLQAAPVRACLVFEDGVLCFKDVRRFGTISMTATREEAIPAGVDPLSPRLTARRLEALIAGSRTHIKTWLLRQDKLAGVGNIYASECLFLAGIHPAREAGSLGRDECSRLLRFIRKVLRTAIEAGGTTFSTFQNVYGGVGSYQHNLKVYDHEGDSCPGCGRSIQRIVQAQRSTFLCPHCQSM
jgi:formamidopyrimidine-DNA glycosylase